MRSVSDFSSTFCVGILSFRGRFHVWDSFGGHSWGDQIFYVGTHFLLFAEVVGLYIDVCILVVKLREAIINRYYLTSEQAVLFKESPHQEDHPPQRMKVILANSVQCVGVSAYSVSAQCLGFS